MKNTDFISREKECIGTVVQIKLPDSALFPLCFDEIKRIESKYSRFIENSQLSLLNSNLNKWIEVDDEFLMLLRKALEYKENTKGNFDITIKDTLDRLGYDSKYSFKEKKGMEKIFDEPVLIKKNKVMIKSQIDFGGFGKGYALDRISELLEEKGAKEYYINAGGDIVAHGNWAILLEHPDDASRAFGTVLLNGAIAGSAANRRRWENSHHLINSSTRLPQNSNKAVFVITEHGMDADAYATAIFTAGFSDGIEISKSLPIEVLITSSQNKVYKSKGFNVSYL
ncbi:FAD:protein FMN transferase [Candidatus Woesearchaeota archaeon]|nr:FAD:protein FMN transferase [Candidatus Woesearchaeota archaeon]